MKCTETYHNKSRQNKAVVVLTQEEYEQKANSFIHDKLLVRTERSAVKNP
jgi:hypothetical protein